MITHPTLPPFHPQPHQDMRYVISDRFCYLETFFGVWGVYSPHRTFDKNREKTARGLFEKRPIPHRVVFEKKLVGKKISNGRGAG